jgi:hypothetical protein
LYNISSFRERLIYQVVQCYTVPTRVQGKCTTQPDAANFPTMNGVALVPTTSGQCLLLTNDDLLGITSGNFWADNLYLRAALPKGKERQYHFPALAVVPPQATTSTAAVFLTHMIFQGDGEGSTVGIGADDKVFVSGLHCICGMF